MAIGERIHFFRNLRGMTQKYLGQQVGFEERSADVRIAQYETGTRSPKEDMTNALAEALGVSPKALAVPDIDTDIGLMHTLFTMEDRNGIRIGEIDGEICIRLDKHSKSYPAMFDMFYKWQQESLKYQNGEISKEEYDHWRYTYPRVESERHWEQIKALRETKAAAET